MEPNLQSGGFSQEESYAAESIFGCERGGLEGLE
jgi:hypothetical protein